LHPKFVENIRNQAQQVIDLNTIADNKNDKGWKPDRRSDYIDIKLKEGYHITKIEVIDDSNVASFFVTIVDISEKTGSFDVFINF
jgi:hypothetical protein